MHIKQEVILACSDVHIPMTDKTWLDWIDYALDVADKIVLVGDIIDMVRFNKKDLLSNDMAEFLLMGLRRLIKSEKCFLVCGNHDPELSKTIKELLDIKIKASKELKIGDILFTHGYQFDPIRKRLPWKFLKKIVPWFVRTPSYWKHRDRKKWHRNIGIVYSNIYNYLEEHKNIELIVIGHTHYASCQVIETGQCLADCGDWLDSRTWLEIRGGEVEIKHWDNNE